jgi:glycerophosphoryl diester phosphodiesterase
MATYCCAHRGAPNTHPENTIPSFLEAVSLGVDMIEFDVRQTADGHLVLMHDKTVDRTTDGAGSVEQLTLAAIKTFDAGSWKDAKFAGTQVPTFAEALDVMPPEILINIELKAGEDIVDLVVAEIMKRGITEQSLLAARNDQADRARELFPDIGIINFSRQDSGDEYVHNTVATGAEYIQLGRGYTTEELVARCHDSGIIVNVFKSDEPDDQRLLMDWEVDYILTDDPRVLMQTLGRLP